MPRHNHDEAGTPRIGYATARSCQWILGNSQHQLPVIPAPCGPLFPAGTTEVCDLLLLSDPRHAVGIDWQFLLEIQHGLLVVRPLVGDIAIAAINPPSVVAMKGL